MANNNVVSLICVTSNASFAGISDGRESEEEPRARGEILENCTAVAAIVLLLFARRFQRETLIAPVVNRRVDSDKNVWLTDTPARINVSLA